MCDPVFNANMLPSGALRAMWDGSAVAQLSRHPRIARVICLGTVLAAELKLPAGQPGGYGSRIARLVTTAMRARGVYARPLGNVVYLMCTPTSAPETTAELLFVLNACLDDDTTAADGAPSSATIV